MERIAEEEGIMQMDDARRFNQVMGKGMVQHEYRELAKAVVAMSIPQDGKVLDVGTGTGFVAIEIASLLKGRGHVVGLDISSTMLTLAAENAAQRGLAEVITWQEGDAKHMPFANSEFDFVVSCGSLHHWEEPAAVFDEIARVLKADGQCIVRDSKRLSGAGPRLLAGAIGLTIPADFRKHYWGSIQSSYTPDELRQLLKQSHLQGWQIQEDTLDILVVKETRHD